MQKSCRPLDSSCVASTMSPSTFLPCLARAQSLSGSSFARLTFALANLAPSHQLHHPQRPHGLRHRQVWQQDQGDPRGQRRASPSERSSPPRQHRGSSSLPFLVVLTDTLSTACPLCLGSCRRHPHRRLLHRHDPSGAPFPQRRAAHHVPPGRRSELVVPGWRRRRIRVRRQSRWRRRRRRRREALRRCAFERRRRRRTTPGCAARTADSTDLHS